MVILSLLAYGCYKERQKEELKNKKLIEKEEGETEHLELDIIERELDQLKDDPDDYNYDYGDPKTMDEGDQKLTNEIKEHLEIHEENQSQWSMSRSSKYTMRPNSPKFGPIRKPERRPSPQRLPYKVQPYLPRPPPPFHYQPSFEQRSYPKEPQFYHQQGYQQRYHPYPDHQRPYSQEPPTYNYYYHNNNNNNNNNNNY